MNAAPQAAGGPPGVACLSPNPRAPACERCAIRPLALFGVLDDAELDAVRGQIQALELAPDEKLVLRGQAASAVFTVRAGVVRFERPTAQGVRRIVRLVGPGDLVGAEALLGLPYADDAIACTAVEVCRIPRSAVESLNGVPGRLGDELMRRWQQAVEASETWLTELGTGSAMRRLLGLLGRLDRYAGADGRIWMPRRDEIGSMLDMTIETASRQVSRLRRAGVLVLDGPRHARLDAKAFAEAVARCDAP